MANYSNMFFCGELFQKKNTVTVNILQTLNRSPTSLTSIQITKADQVNDMEF